MSNLNHHAALNWCDGNHVLVSSTGFGMLATIRSPAPRGSPTKESDWIPSRGRLTRPRLRQYLRGRHSERQMSPTRRATAHRRYTKTRKEKLTPATLLPANQSLAGFMSNRPVGGALVNRAASERCVNVGGRSCAPTPLGHLSAPMGAKYQSRPPGLFPRSVRPEEL